MTGQPLPGKDAIVRLVAALQATRPAYDDFLVFFEKIFLLQEAAVDLAQVPPVPTDPARQKIQGKAGMALLEPGAFPLDPVSVRRNLETICGYAETANDTLRLAAGRLLKHLSEIPEDLKKWATAVQNNDSKALAVICGPLDIEPTILSFFIFHSILPSVLKTARTLAPQAESGSRPHGGCPICGNPPSLSFLDPEGRRWMACGFCRHNWQTPRMFCPTCEKETTREFDYFYSKAEPEYRVYTCQGCRTYLTTVDTRQLDRPFYPPVEQVVTQHLDMAARQAGFTSPANPFLGTDGSNP